MTKNLMNLWNLISRKGWKIFGRMLLFKRHGKKDHLFGFMAGLLILKQDILMKSGLMRLCQKLWISINLTLMKQSKFNNRQLKKFMLNITITHTHITIKTNEIKFITPIGFIDYIKIKKILIRVFKISIRYINITKEKFHSRVKITCFCITLLILKCNKITKNIIRQHTII